MRLGRLHYSRRSQGREDGVGSSPISEAGKIINLLGPETLIPRGFRHLRSPEVDCFLGPKWPERLGICILNALTVLMDSARFPRVFENNAQLRAASPLS